MNYTEDQLKEKIAQGTAELQEFAQTKQVEINEMTAKVQEMVRIAQKQADQMEGRLSVFKEMLYELQKTSDDQKHKPKLKVLEKQPDVIPPADAVLTPAPAQAEAKG